MSRSTAIVALVLAAGASAALALDEASHAQESAGRVDSSLESRLVWALMDVRAGRLDDALAHVSQLIEVQPDFELAHLVRADVLSALGGPLGSFGEYEGLATSLSASATSRLGESSAPELPVPSSRVPRLRGWG